MFENWKKKLMERTEKNAVKSELTWVNSEGESITEVVYLKRSRLPLIGDWARIYPPVNEDRSFNIPNLLFGGKKNFIKLVLVIGLIGAFYLGVSEILNYYKAIESLPCVQQCLNQLV